MKFVVVGVERSKGSFQSRDGQQIDFDNILLHCFTKDDNPRNRNEVLDGHTTAILKIKNDFENRVALNGNPVKNFSELMGCEVRPFYNQYGNLDCVSVVTLDGEI